MEVLGFEDYYYEVWYLVPHYIVSKEMYNDNSGLIKEITYGLWEIYNNTVSVDDYEFITSDMSTERAAKLLTRIFESIQKLGIEL